MFMTNRDKIRQQQLFDAMFNPKRIAVISDVDDEEATGRVLLRNLVEGGYDGAIYPVTPRASRVLGLTAYPRVDALPETADLALIAAPTEQVLAIVEQCGKAGIRGVVILSADPTGRVDALRELKRRYGLQLLGPASLGVMRPSQRLYASAAPYRPEAGDVAVVAQSDAIGSLLLDAASRTGVGVSHFVALGAMVDVSFSDLIDYFGADQAIRCIVMYVERLTDAPDFVLAARHFARTKPILLVKPGTHRKSDATRVSELLTEDRIYDAAFTRAGLLRVATIDDAFHVARDIGNQPLPSGPRLAVIANAGALSVLASDAIQTHQGTLATFSRRTTDRVSRLVHGHGTRGNPIDVPGDAPPGTYAGLIDACLADTHVDGLLIVYSGRSVEVAGELAARVSAARRTPTQAKPIIVATMDQVPGTDVVATFTENHVPVYATPDQAVTAYMDMYRYRRIRDLFLETPDDRSAATASPKMPVRTLMRNAVLADRVALTDEDAEAVLVHCQLPVLRGRTAHTLEEAEALASQIGYPVTLKIASPHVADKAAAGGVIRDVRSQSGVEAAYYRVIDQVREAHPDAEITGVTLQPAKPDGYEVVLGAKTHPLFGPALIFGVKGVGTVLFEDVVTGLPPLNRALARRMIEATTAAALLKGNRDRQPADLDLLGGVLVRFAQMLIDFPEIVQVDIDPLYVDAEEAWVLDAVLTLDKARVLATTPTPPKLVVNPYPTRYEDAYKLRGGREVLLRPVKPEDETLLAAMFRTLSAATKRSRFAQAFGDGSREIMARFCNIDYDAELTLVAELLEEGQRVIAGLSRLIVEADGTTGEIAYLVADPWRGDGLEGKLVGNILDVCKDQALTEVYANIRADNAELLDLVQASGFDVERVDEEVALLIAHLL